MNRRKQLQEALKAKRDEAVRLWNEFDAAKKDAQAQGADVTNPNSKAFLALESAHKTYAAVAQECRVLEDDLMKAIDETEYVETSDGNFRYIRPAGRSSVHDAGRPKALGRAFIERLGGAKALDATVGGTMVPAFYDAEIRALPSRRLFLRDLIPVRTTDSDKVDYVRETVRPDGAAPVAPHGVKPVSTVTLERVTERVRVIATVSESLDRSLLVDVDELVDFVSNEFRFAVLREEEEQILNGSGVGENFLGILNTPGLLTQALGIDPPADAIYKAITKVQLQHLAPDAVVIHPSDFEGLRLFKTADGEYLAAPVVASDPERIWGIPVIKSPAIPEGTALVGSFAAGCTIYDREQARIAWAETGASDSGGDMWSKNELRLRAEERLALAVERPFAFCEVTGI